MEFKYKKIGDKKGRPNKFVVLPDGSEVLYSEWLKTQPKAKRGRKAYERDSEGNIIRPKKVEIDMNNLPVPEIKVTSEFPPEPAEYEASTFEQDLAKLVIPDPPSSFEAIEAMDEAQFDEYMNKPDDDMTDEEFTAFINSVKVDMGVHNSNDNFKG